MAVIVGVLFGGGTYLVLQRTLTRIVLGLALWSHAVNVLLLMAGGRAGIPPLIEAGVPASRYADPLPQAMVLTAIVIGFGITAFLLALAYRSWTLTGNDEVEDDIEDRRIAAEAREAARVEPVEQEAEE
jgi:multicomponent Na+:H+ antiporter subunit C